ncbi:D123-domain-containing protein [Acaromyces ingoldii]|uniref:D123-domain-containing protein n=1 Tax=Acaromyces ingoldii TaxID=215250 RepID=A0A316YV73_9BASI|nr:D123-domain-containing protein [Acaromyces ingoldii]PWN92538.1 D123-domain-containing protein [Acaromyces ingoldii]
MPDVSRAAAAAAASSSYASSSTLPPLTSAPLALQHTRFSSWFPLYRRHSPKATILDLSTLQPDFLEWLEEDGLVLPTESGDAPSPPSSLSGEEEEEEDDDDDEEAEARNFDGLNERIRRVIQDYEGAVFPKLDWSAPADAAWIVPGSTLRCTSPSDVYLLLKSSDFISKDVVQLSELSKMAAADAVDEASKAGVSVRPHLILKKFFAMPTSHEFRCFVRGGHLVAISQRDVGTYFDHLQERGYRRRIVLALRDFFDDVLRPMLQPAAAQGQGQGQGHGQEQAQEQHSEGARGWSGGQRRPARPFPIADFIFDAYITRDLGRVLLVDVNPYLDRTDGLLWTFDEVERRARRAWGEVVEYESEAELQEEASAVELLRPAPGNAQNGIDDDEDDDDDEDARNTFVRIYTDGRPPTVLRETPSNSNSGTTTPRSEAGASGSALATTTTARRGGSRAITTTTTAYHGQQPILRVLTSRAQAHQAFPTHARNMVPADVVDLSEGKSIAEFASEWAGAVARGAVPGDGDSSDSDDDGGSEDADEAEPRQDMRGEHEQAHMQPLVVGR